MPTVAQQKKSDLKKWMTTANIQLNDFSKLTRKDSQNHLRNSIQKISKTMKKFKNSFQWWKNSVEPEELHKAETEFKRIKSLHSTLELEYEKK